MELNLSIGEDLRMRDPTSQHTYEMSVQECLEALAGLFREAAAERAANGTTVETQEN